MCFARRCNRVKNRLIQQKKESVYAALVNQSLQKSHAELMFYGVTFTPSITINLVDQSRTGIIDFGPEIEGIQSTLRAKKLAYSSICVLDHLGREMEIYDKNSLIQFEKKNKYSSSLSFRYYNQKKTRIGTSLSTFLKSKRNIS